MLKKILVAVDGSPESIGAARMAMDLASKYGSEVHLLHVVRATQADYVSGMGFEVPVRIASYDEEWENYGKQIVDKVFAEVQASNVETILEVGHGNPGETLVEAAKNGNFDLIIMGNRGLGAVEGILIGSVSTKVMHLANCPVLIYK